MTIKELLKAATDNCSESWQRFIHERDCHWCPGDDPDLCACDGISIIEEVAKALGIN
jgi:hypothetical protein